MPDSNLLTDILIINCSAHIFRVNHIDVYIHNFPIQLSGKANQESVNSDSMLTKRI
jgi:hypothetical protein